jgi:hypothetical protein
MPHQIIEPTEAQLKRQQRNQRYRANIARREQEKEQDRLYQQKKREQARVRQHQVPLAQLADVVIQQGYLEVENDKIDEAVIIGSLGEGETVDVNDMVEHGEGLGNFDYGHGDGGFPDEVDSEMSDNGDGHGGFPDEDDSETNDDDDDQSDGGFPDEVELDMNDDGSKFVINH